MKILFAVVVLIGLLLSGPVFVLASGAIDLDLTFSTAPRHSAGLAPPPETTPEAVIQVYSARAFSWRGAFGVHTWIAVKEENASRYTVYEVLGWRVFRGGTAVAVGTRTPDGLWFGQQPDVLVDLRGPEAARLIDRIDAAARAYPFDDRYRIWPGPNSNTFTAHVARAVPELRLEMPANAIGKDYLGPRTFVARTPSGTGYQISGAGFVGMAVGLDEGLELTILGLTVGIDPMDLALKLPGVGTVNLWPRS